LSCRRNHLKNVFWPHIFVGAEFQILDNPQVACGLKLGPAAPVSAKPRFLSGEDGIWNQNPILEMASVHLKNVFWPHIFVGAPHQILDPP